MKTAGKKKAGRGSAYEVWGYELSDRLYRLQHFSRSGARPRSVQPDRVCAAVRGRVILVGEISIDIERLVVVNLGLTAVSLFGVVIAIFIGIGLVSKEIDKRTLYTMLSRPVRRWEFVVGKFFGLTGTLVVNTFLMAIGVFLALLYVAHRFEKMDVWVLVALYFIVLQFLIVCALALFFSSFRRR